MAKDSADSSPEYHADTAEFDLFDRAIADVERDFAEQESAISQPQLDRLPLLEEELQTEEKVPWRTRLNPVYRARQFQETWRTSLQFRILSSIVGVVAVTIIILAIVLVNFVSQRLMSTKVDVANSEIDRLRVAVETQLASQSGAGDLQAQLSAARSAVLNQDTIVETQSSYDLVLQVESGNGFTIAPEEFRVPQGLEELVSSGQVAYQFMMVSSSQGSSYSALAIGSPADSEIPGLQVYLLLPMQAENETLSLLRGTMIVVGGIVSLLLATIVWMLMQQVLGPVRSASRIATRFSDGHLRERMVVSGEDEMAALAVSFNKMAESVSKQITELEQYGNLQRQFTSDVSHELRTPITAIRMAAEMVAEYADDLPPVAAKASNHLLTQLDRFESLLADLLEISRFDAGVVELSADPINIADPLRDASEQVKALAEKVGVPIFFNLPDHPVVFEGDRRRVERIIRNLLANAIDHSEKRPIVVTVAENKHAVALSVVDHGVGLKPGQADLVFNRFWRADPSRQRSSGGTGLGLAISREDAALHGGSLDAIGVPGQGSMFRLVLPKEAGTPIEEAPITLVAPAPWPAHAELYDAIVLGDMLAADNSTAATEWPDAGDLFDKETTLDTVNPATVNPATVNTATANAALPGVNGGTDDFNDPFFDDDYPTEEELAAAAAEFEDFDPSGFSEAALAEMDWDTENEALDEAYDDPTSRSRRMNEAPVAEQERGTEQERGQVDSHAAPGTAASTGKESWMHLGNPDEVYSEVWVLADQATISHDFEQAPEE
ncbi:MAG: MtrAB system histidine kinase MtrB [Corynebacterium sp.]|nr:MtrAB system histidine kinase MtrB [Corynebacterium sp.]